MKNMERRKFVRAALSTVVAAGAAGVVPEAAIAAVVAPDRTEWQSAVNRVVETQREVDASCDAFSEAQGQYYAARPKRSLWDGHEFRRGETVEAFNARIAAENRAREDRERKLRRRFGVDHAEQRNSEATDALLDALDDLMECPAPDGAAVIHKIELAREFDLNLDQALVDLHRLFGITSP